MPKPTLVQSILNRPSQTYHFPPTKEYHSTKHDIIRAVSQSEAPGPSTPPMTSSRSVIMSPAIGIVSSVVADNAHNRNSTSRNSMASTSSYHSGRSSQSGVSQSATSQSAASQSVASRHRTMNNQDTSSLQIPDSKRQHRSIASSSSTRHNAPLPQLSTRTTTQQQPPSAFNNNRLPSSTNRNQINKFSQHDSDAEGDDEDDEDDVFYTPRSSLYSSPRTSRASSSNNMIIDPKAIASALLPIHPTRSSKSTRGPHSASSGSRTPSTASLLSITSSTSSSSLGDLGSVIASSSLSTSSTRITSPLNSGNGGLRRQALSQAQAQAQSQNGRTVQTITISSSSSSKKGPQPSSQPSPPRGHPRPLSATANNRKRRNMVQAPQQTYADEDWAKDVRWLAPAIRESPSIPSPRRDYRSLQSEASSAAPSRTYASPQKSYPPASKSAERRHRSRHSRGSRGSRSSRGRMSALLEEDESEYSDRTPGASSTESRPPSPVQEEQNAERSRSVTPTTGAAVKATITRSHSVKIPRTSSPEGMRSGEASVAATSETEDSAELTPDARLRAYARSPNGQRRTYSYTRPLSRSSILTQTTLQANQTDPSIFAKSLPTHSLPTPFPTSTSTVNGYTGLTMAHAGYVNKGKATMNDGKVDLARAGIAQSSMATVEVVRGVAQAQGLSTIPSSPRKKRRTLSFSFKVLGSVVGKARGKGKNKETETPAHLLEALPLPVAFTAHIPPPSYVPSSYVLLQVFAVGLDSLDSLLVQEKIGAGMGAGAGKGKLAGYIPGRSLVGRVIECGWEVKGDVCKKGEWVIGLLDVKKSGALAEFIVIERHRIHSAPQPRSRPTTLFPSASTRRSHARSASLPAHLHALPSYSNLLVPAWNPLSVEELALLPLCALPAHRAVRTFADVIAPPKSSRSPSLVNGDAKAAAAAAAAGSGGGVGGNGGNSSGSGTNAVCILVLNGNDGPGAMALQMLSRRGVRVSVQVPDSAVRSSMEDEDLYSQTEDESSLGIRLSPSKQSNKSPQKSSLLSSPSSPSSPSPPRAMPKKTLYERVEARLKAWGAQEICVGEPLRVIEGLVQDGRAFDGVLDTVGGVEVWEGSQRLLLADPMFDPVRNPPTSPVSPAGSEMSEGGGGGNVYGGRGSSRRGGGKGRGGGGGISQAQFTTLVGDNPARPIPSAHDNFRSGFRSLKRSVSRSVPSSANTSPAKSTVGLPISSSRESFSTLLRKNSMRGGGGRGGGGGGEVKSKKKRIVNYTWVSVSADVDFEGEDVRDSLGAVVGMVEEGWIRPWIDESEGGGGGVVMEMGETRNKLDKIVPFEKSPEVFRRDATGPVGLLKDGGTCVVKIAG